MVGERAIITLGEAMSSFESGTALKMLEEGPLDIGVKLGKPGDSFADLVLFMEQLRTSGAKVRSVSVTGEATFGGRVLPKPGLTFANDMSRNDGMMHINLELTKPKI